MCVHSHCLGLCFSGVFVSFSSKIRVYMYIMFISSQKCCLGNRNMFFYRLTVKLLPKYSVRFGCVGGTSTQPRPVGLGTLNQMHRFKRMPRYFKIQNFCKNPYVGDLLQGNVFCPYPIYFSCGSSNSTDLHQRWHQLYDIRIACIVNFSLFLS